MTGDRHVLVINSGSSSLKFQLVDPDSGAARASGHIERIGEESSSVPDHDAALRRAFDTLSEDGIDLRTCGCWRSATEWCMAATSSIGRH